MNAKDKNGTRPRASLLVRNRQNGSVIESSWCEELRGNSGGVLVTLWDESTADLTPSLGTLLISFLRNGCTLVGISTNAQLIVIGVVIVLAVAVDQFTRGKAGDAA